MSALLELCPKRDPAARRAPQPHAGCRGLARIARRVQRDAELAEELETLRVSFREQRRGTAAQPNGRSCVAALPGCDPCGAEMATRVLGDLRRAPVVLRQELGRLLEMEADDLVRGAARVEQVGRSFVQPRAVGPGDGRIRSFVDERVPKTETLFECGGGRRRIEQAAPDERRERLPHAVARPGARRRARCRTHGRRSRRTRSTRARPASACRDVRSGASAATAVTHRLPRSRAQGAAR